MMESSVNHETIEQKQAMVFGWIKGISETQKVGEMDTGVLREVLVSYGANFENLNDESRESLRGYSENERAIGVRAVWGDEIVDDYKSWVKEYVREYDETHEIKLSVLGEKEGKPYPESGRKNSGMIQFLFELTSYAAEGTNYEDFKEYLETRIGNGVAWAEGRKKDRKKIPVPTSEGKPILIGSFPKEFPIESFEWISSRNKK